MLTNLQPKAIFRKRFPSAIILLIAITLSLSGCLLQPQAEEGVAPADMLPLMTYEVVNTYPHDPTAFTQGLIYHAGYLYESTGLYGESSLRKVALETGEVLQRVELPVNTFGEGLTLWEDRLIQLTWQENIGFIYALSDFALLGQFTYPTEGWGLTQDGHR
jgi:glutaminyl-peptide cyclotransferase